MASPWAHCISLIVFHATLSCKVTWLLGLFPLLSSCIAHIREKATYIVFITSSWDCDVLARESDLSRVFWISSPCGDCFTDALGATRQCQDQVKRARRAVVTHSPCSRNGSSPRVTPLEAVRTVRPYNGGRQTY